MNPVHLSQLPEGWRQTLQALQSQFGEEDRRLEAALLQATRASRLAERVPALLQALLSEHPEISHRAAFQAVALVTGIHVKNVQKVWYRRAKCSK